MMNFGSPVILCVRKKSSKTPFFRLRLRLLCCGCMLFLVCKHTDKSHPPTPSAFTGNNLKNGKTKKSIN